MRSLRPFRPLLVAAAALLCASALVACGASAEPSGTTGDGPDDEKELAFARCMREAGVDIPDPGAGGRPTRVRIPRNVSPAKLQASMQACRKKTGGGPPELSDEQRTEMRDAALKFAKCMRAHGADVPDPTVGPGGGMLLRRSLEADTPAFRRAMEACEDELPLRRGSGGPRGGSTQVEAG